MENLKHEIKDTKGCGKRCHASRLASKTPRSSGLTSHASWPKVKLGDICNIFTGKKDVNQTVANGPYRFFSCAPTLFCSNEYIFDGAAIIIAGNGSYTGRVTYYEGKFDLYQRTYACTIIKPHLADIKFVYDVMRLRFQNEIRGSLKGASIPYIVKGHLSNFQIPLPPLPVQRRIADILSAYDDLIENNRRRIAILEETARLTYRKWFGGMEQGRAATLGKICREVRRGVNPDAIAPDTPYIGLEHMPRRSISLCEWESAQKVTSTKLAFEAGDILFGKIRPYFHKVGITFVDGVASSDAIVIKPLRPELHAYVLMTVSSDAFVAVASQGMKEGSKMPRADWKQLLNYSVAMPDDDTLAEFNKVLNPILEQLKTLCFSIRNLAAARDMLLPRLMKGEVNL